MVDTILHRKLKIEEPLLLALLFVHIIRFFYRQICFIFKSLESVKVNNKICSSHDIAKILLKLALNTNQSIYFYLLLLTSLVHCSCDIASKLLKVVITFELPILSNS